MTLLNDADKVYVGTQEVDAIYLGDTKVWPTGFDPAAFGGLVVWLDASQLTGADGSSVTAWPNIGSGSDPSFITLANRTILKTAFQNGLNVVRFSYNSDALRGTCSMTNKFTAIYAVRHWSGGNFGRALTAAYPGPGPSSNYLLGMHISQADCAYDNGWFHATPMDWTTYLAQTQQNRWRIYSGDMDPAGADHFWVNGVANYSAKGAANGLNTTYNLSGYESTASETCDIDVAELLIYDKVLSNTDRVMVEEYLRDKWSLPGAFTLGPPPDPQPGDLVMP